MTIAISLWLVIGGAVFLYTWAAIDAVANGANPWRYVAGAPLLYLAVVGSFTLLWFGLAWVFRASRPREVRLGIAGTLRLYFEELRAIARHGRHMALFRFLRPDPSPAPATAPVLLLHGVLCNRGSMEDLRRELSARGIRPLYTLSYGPPLSSIERFVDQIAAKIDAILAATGAAKVALVGHSMGGLVARAYLRRYGPDKVSTVIMLGTPHHGSVHAWMFPGTSLMQLRPGSAWLTELNRGDITPPGVRIVSLWSWHDSMVAPQTSSQLDGAVNVVVHGIGHNALVLNRRVAALVADELQRVAEMPPAPAVAPESSPVTSESPA
jgi:triacylglycerol esterase/lipase EstA (alpha/beta hydrolase family)